MKKIKILLSTLLTTAVLFTMAGCGNSAPASSTSSSGTESASEDTSSKNDFKVVASFYPMHIMTMNLTKGIDGVNLSSMSDPNMGCIHDHTFSTEDLKKIENADVFVENGLDLEVFNDKILQTYPDVKIAEASEGITDAVKDGDEVNAHVWTNVDDYIEQVKNISKVLQQSNPQNKDKYSANESAYIDSLNKLKNDYKDKLAACAGKKALILDETLPSFCNYVKIDAISIETDHEEEALSADKLKDTINEMNEKNIRTILIAKDSDRTTAETIAKETGADIYEINTCMVGKVDADAYLNDMKENFDIISSIK